MDRLTTNSEALEPQFGLILVVDDEPPLRTVTRRMLEREGFETLGVGTCDEAMRIVNERSEGVAAVLLDMTMCSSEQLFRHLSLSLPHLVVLLTSGYPLPMLRKRFGLPDRAHFLQKPFSGEVLAKTLRALVVAKGS